MESVSAVGPTISLKLPVTPSDAKRRNVPADSGSLVVYFPQNADAARALPWLSSLIFESFTNPIAVRPISLWANATSIVERLTGRGLDASLVLVRREEFVTAVCNSASDVQAALEIIWPEAEALVCYTPRLPEHERELINAVAKSRALYEGRYGALLPDYRLFVFMESGRLSTEFIGYESSLVKAFNSAIQLRQRDTVALRPE